MNEEADFDKHSPADKSDEDKFVSLVEKVYRKVDEEGLEALEGECSTIASYDTDFEGRAKRAAKKVSECSRMVSEYLEDYGGRSSVRTSDLGEVLEDNGAEVNYESPGYGVDLGDVELDCDMGVQMALNTIGLNEEEHTPEGTEWWAQFRYEEKEGDTDYISIDIWDEGPGIPKEMEGEDLMEKGVSSSENGGKGLYLADRIIEANGGNIEVSEALAEIEDGFGVSVEVPVASTELPNSRIAGTP